jgi:hypothetical protein
MNNEIDATETKDVANNTAATFKFACPHCGQHLEAEPNWAGMECECPGCGKTMTVPQPPTLTPVITVVEKPKITPVSGTVSSNIGNSSWWKRTPKWTYGVAGAAVIVIIALCVGLSMTKKRADISDTYTSRRKSVSHNEEESVKWNARKDTDTHPTHTQNKTFSQANKPWITDSPNTIVERTGETLRKYPTRKETYEKVNMSKIEMFPEEYVGRRFVFDKCSVRQRFRPATDYYAHERALSGFLTFEVQPRSSGKRYGAFDDNIVFVARKTFCRQWIERIHNENYEWPWSVISGTITEEKNHLGKPFYAFVIDEFLICHGEDGEVVLSDVFCEEEVSEKNSPELKSFIVILARHGMSYVMRSSAP